MVASNGLVHVQIPSMPSFDSSFQLILSPNEGNRINFSSQ